MAAAELSRTFQEPIPATLHCVDLTVSAFEHSYNATVYCSVVTKSASFMSCSVSCVDLIDSNFVVSF